MSGNPGQPLRMESLTGKRKPIKLESRQLGTIQKAEKVNGETIKIILIILNHYDT